MDQSPSSNVPPQPPSRRIWPKFIAGGTSCMMISFLFNPMDVIKVRLQLQNQLQKVEVTHFYGGEARYQGFFHAAKRIWIEEGYTGGLMKGITASMIREMSYSSLRMGLYDPIKDLLAPKAKDKNEFTLFQKILAGGLCGAIGSSIVNPTDVVKIRFQSVCPGQPKPYKNTFHGFYSLYKNEGGIKGLYRGVLPTTLRASVLTASQLSSYDHSKRFLLEHHYFQDNVYCHVTASFISGLVTTTATNPVDIVKTRWMSERHMYRGPLDVFLKILKKEGPHALFKGWIPNYLRLGPHSILSLPLYDFLRRMLGVDTV